MLKCRAQLINHTRQGYVRRHLGAHEGTYDLALAGDEMAKGHYDKLTVKAGECVKCGHCESRCPFHVKQEGRMEMIARYFGG